MSSLLINIPLNHEEARILLSSLSANIINYWNDDSMKDEVSEWIGLYKEIHGFVDEKWPGWCVTNSDLKKILDATNASGE